MNQTLFRRLRQQVASHTASIVESKKKLRRRLADAADRLHDLEGRLTSAEARLQDADRGRQELSQALQHSEATAANAEARRQDADRDRQALAQALKDSEAKTANAEARFEDSDRDRRLLATRLKHAGPPSQRHDQHGQPLYRPLPFMPRQIVFVHVPKCGGTALTNYLHTALHPCRVINNVTFVEQCSADYLRSMDLISGHLSWKHLRKIRSDALVFTMVRDPVDRILSHYFAHRGSGESPRDVPYAVFLEACRNLTLRELVREDHPQIRYWISNYMTRQLSRQSEESAVCAPQQLACEAMENLRLYEYVGIYGEFAASLNVLQFLLNWPFVDSLPDANRTDDRLPIEEIDPETIATIRSMNTADIALYDCAVREHRRRFERLGPLIERRRAGTAGGATAARLPLSGLGDRAVITRAAARFSSAAGWTSSPRTIAQASAPAILK